MLCPRPESMRRAHTVPSKLSNWMDAYTSVSRQLPDDLAETASKRRQTIRPRRTIRARAQVQMRSHASRATADPRSARRMGCAACRRREAAAVLMLAARACSATVRRETKRDG